MNSEKKIILLAEDDFDLRLQMKQFLSGKKFEVLEASNEKQALDIVSTQNFDLAILDLMMDNQDSGFIISYKIKKKNSNIPVIIVTAVTKDTGFSFDKSDKNDDNWIKADVVLNKDIRFEQLIFEINRLLGEVSA